MNIILQGKKISRIFQQGKEKTVVLDQIDLKIYEGDFTVIMGSSGAGKSTLLYALSGMDRISGGKVFYKGRQINGLKEKQMARLRAEEFGFVFQQTNLVSSLTLLENVETAGYVSRKGSTREIRERARQLLQTMKAEQAGHRYPSQVSGGEAQRAALARAMIGQPGILFADEPTGALNRSNTTEVLNLLTELNRSGQSILMVTHDLQAAARGSRILYLEDGRLIDELTLPAWERKQEKEREEKLSSWLTGLQW